MAYSSTRWPFPASIDSHSSLALLISSHFRCESSPSRLITSTPALVIDIIHTSHSYLHQRQRQRLRDTRIPVQIGSLTIKGYFGGGTWIICWNRIMARSRIMGWNRKSGLGSSQQETSIRLSGPSPGTIRGRCERAEEMPPTPPTPSNYKHPPTEPHLRAITGKAAASVRQVRTDVRFADSPLQKTAAPSCRPCVAAPQSRVSQVRLDAASAHAGAYILAKKLQRDSRVVRREAKGRCRSGVYRCIYSARHAARVRGAQAINRRGQPTDDSCRQGTAEPEDPGR